MGDHQNLAQLASEAMAGPPEVAVVLGSGLAGLAERCTRVQRIRFADLADWAEPTVTGHRGCLTLANWAGRRIVLFEGRLHYYEGHPWERVTVSAALAHGLGARVLIFTNAAGGIHDALVPGSLMIIRDHLEWTWPYCWRRPGPGGLGRARPAPYSTPLSEKLLQTAISRGIDCRGGVYAAVTGPCYETPAEIRALKHWGADAVGMSTAREAQAACELGLECIGLSLITNRAAGLSPRPISHEEVLAMGKTGGKTLGDLLEGFFQLL